MAIRRGLMAAASSATDYLIGVVWVDGYLINDAGGVSANANSKYTDTYIPVIPGNSYVLSGKAYSIAAYDRIHGYNAEKAWQSRCKKLFDQ